MPGESAHSQDKLTFTDTLTEIKRLQNDPWGKLLRLGCDEAALVTLFRFAFDVLTRPEKFESLESLRGHGKQFNRVLRDLRRVSYDIEWLKRSILGQLFSKLANPQLAGRVQQLPLDLRIYANWLAKNRENMSRGQRALNLAKGALMLYIHRSTGRWQDSQVAEILSSIHERGFGDEALRVWRSEHEGAWMREAAGLLRALLEPGARQASIDVEFHGASPIELLPSASVVPVATCFRHFKLWRGSPIANTYGGKAVLDYNGEPLFAELAILRLIQEGGWQGVWIDTYRRKFRQFLPPHSCDLPPHAQNFLDQANQGRKWRSGCSDVLAWDDGRYLFVEAKRKGKDRIRKTQREWLELALNSGVPLESFLIFEWSIADAKPTSD